MHTDPGTGIVASNATYIASFFFGNSVKQAELTEQAFEQQFTELMNEKQKLEQSPEHDSFFRPSSPTIPTSGLEATMKEALEALLATGIKANIPQAHFEYAKMILSDNKHSLACQHFELAAQLGHSEAALWAARMLIGTAQENFDGYVVVQDSEQQRLNKIQKYYWIAGKKNPEALAEYTNFKQMPFGHLRQRVTHHYPKLLRMFTSLLASREQDSPRHSLVAIEPKSSSSRGYGARA